MGKNLGYSVNNVLFDNTGNAAVPVITTIKTILSTALNTQDVAGMVTYINTLTPVLDVGLSEIVKFIVSDNNQIYELILRGRSFGVDQPAITSNDLIYFKNITDYVKTGSVNTVYKDDFIADATKKFIVPENIMITNVFINFISAKAGDWNQAENEITVTTAQENDSIILTGNRFIENIINTVILTSPNNNNYKLIVSDTGVLGTEEI